MPGSLFRRQFLVSLCAIALAACSGGDNAGENVRTDDLVDMTMGSENAPMVLIEYASTTCPACAAYNRDMKETIKQLTDEGKLRFVFREFPRDGVDIAAFVTARCAGDDKYFDVLDDLFASQQGIIASARNGSVRTALQAIGARHGVEAAQFDACLEDVAIRSAISNAAKAGDEAGVTGTPTLFLNGVEILHPQGRTPESLIELVDGPSAG